MPKPKTHKATAKRIKVTKKRKLRRLRQGRSHFRRRKSKRALRSMDKYLPAAQPDEKRLRRLLGLRQRKA